jgi:hypothetical protein
MGDYERYQAELSVSAVLKGQYAAKHLCVFYLFPAIAYSGAWLRSLEEGRIGVFALRPWDKCLHVVNDGRPIMPIYREASVLGNDRSLAEATFPVHGDCSSPEFVEDDLLSITEPLVGTRLTRAMLKRALSDGSENVRACSCLMLAAWYDTDDFCLRNIPPSLRNKVDEVREARERGRSRELQHLRSDPVEWLKFSMANGLDGTVLTLYDFTPEKGALIETSVCHMVKENFQSGAFNLALSMARDRSPDVAESAALQQFGDWLNTGCPAKFDPFRERLNP